MTIKKKKSKFKKEQGLRIVDHEKSAEFVAKLSKYTSCIHYIALHVGLPDIYQYGTVIKTLSTINSRYKLEFIRTKLFEILLTLPTDVRNNLIFADNEDNATILREVWTYHCEYYKDYISGFKINSEEKSYV